jgi:hypothetical protein
VARLRSKIVASVVGAFVVTGLVLLLCHPTWQMLDPPYEIVALLLSPLVLAALIAMFRAWDDNRARVGGTAGILQIGLLVFALIVWGFLPAANAFLDDSTPRNHVVEVRDRGRQRGSSRPVHVESWRGKAEGERLRVDADIVDGATHLIVTTRAGGLGFEWVERIRASHRSKVP